ncbi:imidazole glycerol phosphate synthase [Pseudoalteromonas luteoviolacea]|nr:imidazole glycerol phosphate synthase [Pseudoalteromonas luteoviolacea]
MLETRVIPCLLLRNESLVKTIKFDKFGYIGDPCNTVRIFNELEVDELVFLDITATNEQRTPNLKLLKDIADECFMPLAYGGGISSLQQAKEIFAIGFEKVILNSHTVSNPELITEIAEHFGNQAVVVSIDVRKSKGGEYQVFSHAGTKKVPYTLLDWATKVESLGAGEILLTNIDREGTWDGYDYELIESLAGHLTIPVVANGGAGGTQDFVQAKGRGASAIAAGSLFVYQKKGMGVLVNMPERPHNL